ncbi:MAG: hypothetical protein PHV52_00005 [Aliarcobacter sp.]|nr:hypothetical protein [Aliarcobacter sp.]
MLVFDSEIKKAIRGRGEEQIPGIEYCEGWKDFIGMGISIVGVYDFREAKYRVFLDDNLSELQELIDNREFCIGFNNESFDNKLLAAHGINISEEKSFDLLKAIKEVTGTNKGFGLGAICEANFRTSKNGDGAFAPILWQQKQYGKVIDYCLNDVSMTLKVLTQLIDYEFIVDPRNEENTIGIELPFNIRNIGLNGFSNNETDKTGEKV